MHNVNRLRADLLRAESEVKREEAIGLYQSGDTEAAEAILAEMRDLGRRLKAQRQGKQCAYPG